MKISKYVLGEYQTNSYLVTRNNLAMVIDPGYKSDKLINNITTNNLDLKYIFLTHGHFDHVGGVNYLKEKFPKAQILIHQNDLIWLEENDYNLTRSKVTYDKVINSEISFLLDDLECQIIFTPGHTSGGMSLLINNHLFVGDTLFNMSIGRTDFPFGDFKTLERSIKRLYQLPDETIVYPGHGDNTTIGFEKKYNYFVKG
ncbi:MAG: MBL fold metallo-hydrolase [Acholeplasmataceae bacterium]|jgi:glyoxylase-like metal-dependent hydrolase (beta-lactamase superfamily II)